jgi:hypothetical protein
MPMLKFINAWNALLQDVIAVLEVTKKIMLNAMHAIK